jgi:hypothetical protein
VFILSAAFSNHRIIRLTWKKFGDSGESGESALQPQRTPTGSEVGPGEFDVSLVIPGQLQSLTSELVRTETKPKRERDETGTTETVVENQRSKLKRNRNKPVQKRDKTGTNVEKSA